MCLDVMSAPVPGTLRLSDEAGSRFRASCQVGLESILISAAVLPELLVGLQNPAGPLLLCRNQETAAVFAGRGTQGKFDLPVVGSFIVASTNRHRRVLGLDLS